MYRAALAGKAAGALPGEENFARRGRRGELGADIDFSRKKALPAGWAKTGAIYHFARP